VLVVDDHPAIRAGLERLLDDQPDLRVVRAVSAAEAALSVAESEAVDVVVTDYQLNSRSGLWLSRKLKRLAQAPRVVMYSAYCDGPLAAACVVAEADALVSKSRGGAELCDVVRLVARGGTRLPFVPPALAGAMRRRLGTEEQAIFGLLLAGIERGEVAKTLRLSQADVDSRMGRMLGTLEGLGREPAPHRPARAVSSDATRVPGPRS
jgi:DNA-binding NarL/FixJ family response regulator